MEKIRDNIKTALASLMGLNVSGAAAIAMGKALEALLEANREAEELLKREKEHEARRLERKRQPVEAQTASCEDLMDRPILARREDVENGALA